MSVKCTSCNALHWMHEPVSHSSMIAPKLETCCRKGDVQLETLKPLPEYLHYVLNSTDPIARNFRPKIIEYNSALAFTSVKYQPENRPEVQGS